MVKNRVWHSMKMKFRKMSLELKILIASLIISVFFICLGISSGDRAVLGNSIILAAFAIAAPLFFIRYLRYRALKEMEEKFPLFLRDMIEALRSGVPFHTAVTMASKYDYGKLTPEIKKMASQISWGMSFDKVMEQFAERVKQSKRLSVVSKIIKETYLSGGDIVSTLDSVADTVETLEDAEKERRSLLSQYVVLMYAINFLFVGIAVGINKLMVPIFQVGPTGQAEVIGLQNPCGGCGTSQDPSCLFCGMLDSVSAIFGAGNVRESKNIGAYYTSLFFFMSMIESVCCGLVAGQISESSVIAGIKHSLIMVIITFGSFFILVSFGLMGV